MALTHHPSSRSLSEYATLQLGAGAALLVASHLERCSLCSAANLDASAGRGIAAGVSSCGEAVTPAAPRMTEGKTIGDGVTFVELGGYARGAWRWAGAGLRTATVRGAAGIGERVYLLRGRPGAELPTHTHRGSEWVLVLEGAYTDGDQRFELGDVSEHHDAHTHSLTVTADAECICLVVTDRPAKIHGIGRLLEPFLKL